MYWQHRCPRSRVVIAEGRCRVCDARPQDEAPVQVFLSLIRALTMVKLDSETVNRPMIFKTDVVGYAEMPRVWRTESGRLVAARRNGPRLQT